MCCEKTGLFFDENRTHTHTHTGTSRSGALDHLLDKGNESSQHPPLHTPVQCAQTPHELLSRRLGLSSCHLALP